jgi:Tol biopolymer transport system component
VVRSANLRARTLMVAAVMAVAASCLYQPPRQLPSSIRILYSKTTEDSIGRKVDIYFLVAREGNELRLTGEGGDDRQPTFASDLRKVFFTRTIEGRDEIWSMDLDGSQESAVLAGGDAGYRDPAVGRDEARLAFTRVAGGSQELWLADVDGGDPRPLLTEGGPWSRPAWSPDGRTLAVVGGAPGAGRIFLVDPESGSARPLSPSEPAGQGDPAWSPDGKRIVFVRGTGPRAEIAVAEVATGAVERLTTNEVEEGSPAWSPNGERIAFVSRRPSGRDNVWLMDPDGGNVEALTGDEHAQARDPDWL